MKKLPTSFIYLNYRPCSYETLYHLTNAKYPAGKQVSYAYDPAGNRTQKVDGATTLPYTYDTANRLLSAGDANYEYDHNGNITKKVTPQGETTYAYDIENRPLTITYPQAAGLPDTQFEYAPYGKRVMFCPFGKRVKKTDSTGTRYYLHDEENVLMEFDPAGVPINKYTTTLGVDEIISMTDQHNNDFWYLYDGLGSVAMLTDKMGDVVQIYNYDAFGKPNVTAWDKNPYKFTGREYDPDSQLYYYRARFYDADTGRFIQKDPLTIEGTRTTPLVVSKPTGQCMSYSFMPGLPSTYYSSENLQRPITLHRYIYTLDNPLNYTDPFGLLALATFDLNFFQLTIDGTIYRWDAYSGNRNPYDQCKRNAGPIPEGLWTFSEDELSYPYTKKEENYDPSFGWFWVPLKYKSGGYPYGRGKPESGRIGIHGGDWNRGKTLGCIRIKEFRNKAQNGPDSFPEVLRRNRPTGKIDLRVDYIDLKTY